MKLHRLTRTIYIGHELRIGRFVAKPDPYIGQIIFIWFRHSRTNHVLSLPYRKPKALPPMPEYITKYERLPVCDRDLDPDIGRAIAMMLDRYCVWLNEWLASDPYPVNHTYNPRQFLDTTQTEPYLYGSCLIDSIFTSNWYNVVAITIYDGDDGGPTSLIGWFREYGRHWGHSSMELVNMTQEFDTMIHFIMQEGKFVNGPKARTMNTQPTTKEQA